MSEFGTLIKRTRESRRLRGFDLGMKIGQDPSWLSRVEAGRLTHPPAPNVMHALRDTLDLSMVEMFEAMGYDFESGPSEPDDEVIRRLRRVTSKWSSAQREAVWALIQNASALLDSGDDSKAS